MTDILTTQSQEKTAQKSNENGVSKNHAPTLVKLTEDQVAGHGDHWAILTDDIENAVMQWLQKSIDTAGMPVGLGSADDIDTSVASHLLLADERLCHINQVLALQDGKPKGFINAFPCVNSPYGVKCKIERIIANEGCNDAVLCLLSDDGTRIYAFDQLFTVNKAHYQKDMQYFVNLSAWAYNVTVSSEEQVIRVEDPEAIRYHRAFNDIVASNGGVPPEDIEEQISAWQPSDVQVDNSDSDSANTQLAPVEINLGHMCAYLFGDTLGQEDEAWCQGQVLGKQQTEFFGQAITVLDVAILREPDTNPCVVRIAVPNDKIDPIIGVNDYIQANIWLQAAIYRDNQKAVASTSSSESNSESKKVAS